MIRPIKILSFVIGVFACLSTHAQNHHPEYKRTNHWFFGDGAGLDFSSGQAVADTSGSLYTAEGCSVMSDTAGNLLFYTNGIKVWNKNHQVMPNGDSLDAGGSSYNSTVIVPWPRNPNKYYIITADDGCYCGGPLDPNSNWPNKGIMYSLVDMSADNGNGDVVLKNIPLMAPSHENLAATLHADGERAWVMAHKRNEEKYYCWLVGTNGLDTNAVISTIGNAVNAPVFSLGCRFSPDGSRFAAWIPWQAVSNGVPDSIEVYDFDNNSGLLYNRRTFADSPSIGSQYYGLEFSRNARYLYVNVNPNSINNRLWTLRYDCMMDTFRVLDTIFPIPPYTFIDYSIMSLNLDQNDNIVKPRETQDTLNIIHNASSPNAYTENAWMGLQGRTNRWCLPNFISNYFGFDPATTGKPEDVFYHGDESFCTKAFQSLKIDFANHNISLPYFFREGQILLTNLKGETLFSHQIHSAAITSQLPDIQENIVLVTLKDDLHVCTQKYSQNK
jgi:hypothetical protein